MGVGGKNTNLGSSPGKKRVRMEVGGQRKPAELQKFYELPLDN